MAQITVNVTGTATAANITKTIQGLEMVYGRQNGETDLEYVKRLFGDMLKQAYKRKREAEVVTDAIANNPVDNDLVIT